MFKIKTKITGDLKKLNKALPNLVNRMVSQVIDKVDKLSENYRDEILGNIEKGGIPNHPLHPFTINQKLDDKPLIETGHYLDSIVLVKTSKGNDLGWFIGLDKNTKSLDGRSLVPIAMSLELGNLQFITDKMRIYLISHGMALKPETQYIYLPARPHIRPAIANAQMTFEEQIFRESISTFKNIFS